MSTEDTESQRHQVIHLLCVFVPLCLRAKNETFDMKKIILLLVCLAPVLTRASDVLKPNDLLAICGDSITEQKMYSVYIEDYLLMCQPVSGVQSMQFGWSGEKADGFLKRMDNDVLRFKPRVATTCYGMNDGGYQQLTDAIANT